MHERYGDRDGYVDTLLVTAEARLEMDEVDAASELVRLAEARLAEGGSTYDQTHWEVVSAALARARREPHAAIAHAVKARRESEAQALVAFHFYAMALEAAARTDAGEVHAATLLATTAMGAVDALQGCEFGLEVRVLAADVLKRAGSPQARVARQRAVDFAQSLRDLVREPRLARSFAERLLACRALRRPRPPRWASVAPDGGTTPSVAGRYVPTAIPRCAHAPRLPTLGARPSVSRRLRRHAWRRLAMMAPARGVGTHPG